MQQPETYRELREQLNALWNLQLACPTTVAAAADTALGPSSSPGSQEALQARDQSKEAAGGLQRSRRRGPRSRGQNNVVPRMTKLGSLAAASAPTAELQEVRADGRAEPVAVAERLAEELGEPVPRLATSAEQLAEVATAGLARGGEQLLGRQDGRSVSPVDGRAAAPKRNWRLTAEQQKVITLMVTTALWLDATS